MIKIKTLSEKEIPQIIELANKIFLPILQGLDKGEDKNIWNENYTHNGLLLGAYTNETLVGFLFFYKKDPEAKSMHWWMDGVDEKFRKQGILTALAKEGLEKIKTRGYEYVTVNTFPEKFPVMYSFLQKHDFEQYKEEQKDWNGEMTIKAFFKKKL